MLNGERDKLYAFREESEVIHSFAAIKFLGKEPRQTVTLNAVPVLVVLEKEGYDDEQDIVLGVNGIFDAFDITFKKSKNRIILKPIDNTRQ